MCRLEGRSEASEQEENSRGLQVSPPVTVMVHSGLEGASAVPRYKPDQPSA